MDKPTATWSDLIGDYFQQRMDLEMAQAPFEQKLFFDSVVLCCST